MAETAFVNEEDEKKSMEEDEDLKKKSKCDLHLIVRILDTAALIALIAVQGTALNLMLWEHSGRSSEWLGLFAGDIFIAIVFIVASTVSHRRLLIKLHSKIAHIDIPKVQIPMYGVLPFGYIAWFLYATFLATRIALIVRTGTAADLPTDIGPLSSTAFMLALAAAAAAFVLLVHTHSDAEPSSTRATYISDLCKGTTFDIIDSVSFLGLLLPGHAIVEKEGIGNSLKLESLSTAILVLACINYFLPTLALMKLSLSDFCERSHPVRLELLYKTSRFLLVDLPYLIIRIYMWQVDRSGALFVAKNALYVLITLRYLIPEYIDAMRRKRKIANGTLKNEECDCNTYT